MHATDLCVVSYTPYVRISLANTAMMQTSKLTLHTQSYISYSLSVLKKKDGTKKVSSLAQIYILRMILVLTFVMAVALYDVCTIQYNTGLAIIPFRIPS